MIEIGPIRLDSRAILAPMAGVTDRPFRQLCRRLGAGMAVSEMLTCDTSLWQSRKSSQRLAHAGEPAPRSVQIAGADPAMMASAAREAVARGAQLVDINMGCPAKKVCKQAAGSALLRDIPLVERILREVVAAVEVPVTLKYRTGWDREHNSALQVARIAEDAGIRLLSLHGRSRACGYGGEVDYDSIAAVVQAVSIPVLANGDICSAQQARRVLEHTGAAGVMIGRAAQGNPWIFREINHHLRTGQLLPPPAAAERQETLLAHVRELHAFYGEHLGVRIARKHVGWYLKSQPDTAAFRALFNAIEDPASQLEALEARFDPQQHNEEAA